eukprot:TRINITY_DN2639_c0_g1_i11.p1 TRINITY_DN2639_c0_g1~~TRINITY_DN2639_c0_g1_i11.p1  ORF type:complete len:298 (-),score=38.87 TRINITY_DN2639_c0_g1_i11:160-1053(-)
MKFYMLLMFILFGICIFFIFQYMELNLNNYQDLEDNKYSQTVGDYKNTLPRMKNLRLDQQVTTLSQKILNSEKINETKQQVLMMIENEMYSEEEFIQSAVNSNRVVVFSKTRCPFSLRAKKSLMDTFPAEIISVFEVDQLQSRFPNLQQNLRKITGISTVPQIFIDGCFVGDSELIVHFVSSGEAKQLIDHNNKTIRNYKSLLQKYYFVLFAAESDEIPGTGKDLVDILRTKFEKVDFNVSIVQKNNEKCSIQQQLLSQDVFPQFFIGGTLIAVGENIRELYQGGYLEIQASEFKKI